MEGVAFVTPSLLKTNFMEIYTDSVFIPEWSGDKNCNSGNGDGSGEPDGMEYGHGFGSGSGSFNGYGFGYGLADGSGNPCGNSNYRMEMMIF